MKLTQIRKHMKLLPVLTLTGCICLCISACGAGGANETTATESSTFTSTAEDSTSTEPSETSGFSSLTMEDLIEANQTDHLLETYSSIYISPLEKEQDFFEWYAAKDVLYFGNDTHRELILPDNVYYYDQETYYGMALPDEDKENDLLSSYSCIAIDSSNSTIETITDVTRENDVIQVNTELSAEEYGQIFKESDANYVEGDSSAYTYTLNAADLAVLKIEQTVFHADGTKTISGVNVAYNETCPDSVQTMIDRQSGEDTRTVTVVMNPKTAQEQSFSGRAHKGENVGLYNASEGSLYFDPECTKIYEGIPDPNKDLTLYFIPNAE